MNSHRSTARALGQIPNASWRPRKERRRTIAELVELASTGRPENRELAKVILRGIMADASTQDSNRIGAARELRELEALEERNRRRAELDAELEDE